MNIATSRYVDKAVYPDWYWTCRTCGLTSFYKTRLKAEDDRIKFARDRCLKDKRCVNKPDFTPVAKVEPWMK